MAISTRERVLETLLKRQSCSINELAEVIGINPISVRHHLIKLEADGLVTSDIERHGVGRPRRQYFLTDAGIERFPTGYLRLTVRLLEQIKETLPPETIHNLFTNMAKQVAKDYTAEIKHEGTALEDRLVLLQDLLTEEGFNIYWERVGDEYHIRGFNCPYYRVGKHHPEVCSVDHALINAVLATQVRKSRCILSGDDYCMYIVSEQ
ncbi:MAG: ArsR family transcriptional regulator [Chloroflexota bacterium]